MQQNDQFS